METFALVNVWITGDLTSQRVRCLLSVTRGDTVMEQLPINFDHRLARRRMYRATYARCRRERLRIEDPQRYKLLLMRDALRKRRKRAEFT